jgi:hypothetical protein
VKASRPGLLVAVAVVAGALVWLVLRFTYSSLPPLPWTAVPTLLLLALGETWTGFNIRGRIHRKPGTKPEDVKPVEPLVTARMAALGKASAHAAAALAGVFGGFAVYLGGSLDKPSYRSDFGASVGTFVSSVALVVAALFLEWCCRVPKDPDQERDQPPPYLS